MSNRKMVEDIRRWSAALPKDLLAIAGIPRSGSLVAAHLALHRNIHLATLEELKNGRRPWEIPLRRGVSSKEDGPVLIVDDSIDSGDTIHAVWRDLKTSGRFLYGSLYYKSDNAMLLDFAFQEVPSPRFFEWNLFHCQQMSYSCLDLDGVICEDWLGHEEDTGPGHVEYLSHITHAKPKFLPTTFPALAIITSRLEKYRPQTEAWLRRHGVSYRELVMAPHETAGARRAARDASTRKADFYTGKPDARLFIESDIVQAKEIAATTGRPVLCVQTMELY